MHNLLDGGKRHCLTKILAVCWGIRSLSSLIMVNFSTRSHPRRLFTSYFLPKLMVRLTVLSSLCGTGAEIQQVLLEGLLRSVSRLAGWRRSYLVASQTVVSSSSSSRVVPQSSLRLRRRRRRRPDLQRTLPVFACSSQAAYLAVSYNCKVFLKFFLLNDTIIIFVW